MPTLVISHHEKPTRVTFFTNENREMGKRTLADNASNSAIVSYDLPVKDQENTVAFAIVEYDKYQVRVVFDANAK
ncbi:hypothetical protein CS022_04630 [Veronia nyctiphanis]|uniref:Uncharacterized protein n=1 Tax=Veronia nyctiphanis TaxID=1278244 RepID=A0A4Q0YZ04_9GAMM|nr:hypothetical protein [Veronia nyctiphanis]RXJ74341.1 hypothetical protein CS022_04630 [Veronia nyctiphanis]